MDTTLRVSICQIKVVAGEREGNLNRVERALEVAASQRSQLAIFPESAILGWLNPDAHHLADPIPGRDSDRLCDLAKSVGCAMVIGLDERQDGNLFGAAVAVCAQGELVAVHRKFRVLPELMDPPYTPGHCHHATVAEFSFGKVAILVCADTFEPEAIASVRASGASILAVPYGWVAEPEDWPDHGERLRALVCRLAIELDCAVVGVDSLGEVAAGPWKGRKFCGASTAADRRGNPMTDRQFSKTFIQTVEVEV